MNEVNFPQILQTNMGIPGSSHVTSSQRAHKGKNFKKNNYYQQI